MTLPQDPNAALRAARRRPGGANLLRDRLQLGLYHLLRRLPPDWAAAPGRWLTRRELRLYRPWVAVRARANLQRLRPEDDAARREARLAQFLEGLAAFVGEVPTIGRQARHGRLRIEGGEHLLQASRAGGAVLLGLHLGNWEMLSESLQVLGLPVASFYEEAETATQTAILRDLRRRCGITLLEPDIAGLRQALRLLAEGRMVALFADHLRAGRVTAPLFGRPPPRDGNLAVAARLARGAGLPVLLGYVLRDGAGGFVAHWLPPLQLPPGGADLAADVRRLNALIEPLVLAHPEQWYFLDDRLD